MNGCLEGYGMEGRDRKSLVDRLSMNDCTEALKYLHIRLGRRRDTLKHTEEAIENIQYVPN